jgi:hypothetical protein
MYKKTVTYEDFNGTQRTEDFYFNLTKAELMKLQMGTNGGLDERLTKIIKSQDVVTLLKEFEEIVLIAYGEKSEDGKRFVKNDEVRENFKASAAYSEIYVELATNSEEASKFITGIMPADIDTSKATELLAGDVDPTKAIEAIGQLHK